MAKVRLRKRGEAGGAKEEVRGGAGAGGLRRRADAMGRLHCTQDPVPEAVGGDMQQLNQLDAQVGRATATRDPQGGLGPRRGWRFRPRPPAVRCGRRGGFGEVLRRIGVSGQF